MTGSADGFAAHLLRVDRRNSYDRDSHQARVYVHPETEASALFVLEPEAVVARLRGLETEVGTLWADAPLDLRTYRLLSIHLMESVRDDPDEVFRITPTGVVLLHG